MLSLRLATKKDTLFLFQLVNEPAVRANSFSSEPIAFDDHQIWLQNTLEDESKMLFVAESNHTPIGQLRVDIYPEKKYGLISFSVTGSHRSKGYGTAILNACVDMLSQDGFPVDRFVGYVKKKNVASQKAFIKASFLEIEGKDKNEYWYPNAK